LVVKKLDDSSEQDNLTIGNDVKCFNLCGMEQKLPIYPIPS
jgi:hypothetical protein